MTCLHRALGEQERDDIREAAERLMVDGAKFRSTDEWVEAVLDEAEAIGRRREMTLVRTCPHCGEAIES